MGGVAWHGVLEPRPGKIDVHTEHRRDSRAWEVRTPIGEEGIFFWGLEFRVSESK